MPKIRVTWEKIRVHKSEFYALIGGEPGGSAEWLLHLGGGAGTPPPIFFEASDHLTWSEDGIRDNHTYEVDQFLEFDAGGAVGVRFSGAEKDDSSKWDTLPEVVFTVDPDPRWANGPIRYKKKASADDYSYTVYFTIEHVETFGGVLTPGSGVLFDTRFSGLWDTSSERVHASVGLTADEVNAEARRLWSQGGRLSQLQPFVQGSTVRYNVIWNFSGIRQLWNINCDEAHFVATTGDTWSWARPHQVIPFVVDGRLRYAALWNEGQHAQRWHHNTDEASFRAITGETWSWARPHQVYAFTIGGQVRYSCLWNAGQQAVLWHPNCGEEEAYKLGGDNWAWGRGHQMQPFGVNGGRRFSVLWQEGQHGQLWNLNCDAAQIAANTADVEEWGRPRQLYATVAEA